MKEGPTLNHPALLNYLLVKYFVFSVFLYAFITVLTVERLKGMRGGRGCPGSFVACQSQTPSSDVSVCGHHQDALDHFVTSVAYFYSFVKLLDTKCPMRDV